MFLSRKNRDPVAKAALSVAGSLTGVPGAGSLAQLLFQPIVTLWDRRHSTALIAAEQLSGSTRKELAERIKNEPSSLDRVVRLLYAAGHNGDELALKAMGESLVRGLIAAEANDRAALDDEEAILAAIASMGARHFAALEVIAATPLMDNVAFAQAVQESDAYPDLTLSQLHQAALVENPYGRLAGDNGEDRFYALTGLGRLVIEAVTAAAQRSKPRGKQERKRKR